MQRAEALASLVCTARSYGVRRSRALSVRPPFHIALDSRLLRVITAGACLSLVVDSGCTDRELQRSSAEDEAGVRDARRRWNSALVARDSVALAQLVEDSAMHVSVRFAHSGRSAYLGQFIRAMTARPQFQLTYLPERVVICQRPNCQMATEYGTWNETWLEDGEPTEVRGTYYAIWRHHGEMWQIQREAFATTQCRGKRYCGS